MCETYVNKLRTKAVYHNSTLLGTSIIETCIHVQYKTTFKLTSVNSNKDM